jgi:exopolysaccharide biosynthesis polyprenyl glycosylphosphotransferase
MLEHDTTVIRTPVDPSMACVPALTVEAAADDAPVGSTVRPAVFAVLFALSALAVCLWGQIRPTAGLATAAALAGTAAWLTFDGLGRGGRGPGGRTAWTAAAGGIAAATLAAAGAVGDRPLSPGTAAAVGAAAGVALLASAELRRLENRCRAGRLRVFLVGTTAQLGDLATEIDRSGHLDLVGAWLTDGHGHRAMDPQELALDVRASQPTMLVLSEEAMRDQQLVAAASLVNLAGVRVRPLRTFYEGRFGKIPVSELSPAWFLFDIAEIHRRGLYGMVKRAAETTLAAALLVAVAPILPVIALLIRLSSPGPVLFGQQRVGRGGQSFRLVKFRTMHPDSEREHGTWASANSERIFAVGAFLRRTRLDELPQLWNVIRGELSIVGPRPEQPSIVARLEQQIPFYAARQLVRPGLTGWAQVQSGYGGSVAGTVTKLQFDLYYIKRQSLALDLTILASTARTMLRASGH